MRRYGRLFPRIVSLENLWAAWREFRRGKRGRPSVRRFELEADRHILRLHRELEVGRYRTGGYRIFAIREPKKRLIAAAPVRDRVLHHAIHRVLAPLLDPSLIHSTYACLPGRGSHRAVLAHQRALRRYRFVLALDIRHYFPSIDREILMRVMEAKLKDATLLGLLREIAESGGGLYRRDGVAAFLGFPPGFPGPSAGLSETSRANGGAITTSPDSIIS